MHLICCGLLIPSQAAAKTMAMELRKCETHIDEMTMVVVMMVVVMR